MEIVLTTDTKRSGFTLVELLIASACMLLIVGAAYGIFSQQLRQTSSEQYTVEMQMNSKVAMERLHFIFSHAGFGCRDSLHSGKTISGDDPDGNSVSITSPVWNIENNAPGVGSDSVVVVYGFRKVGEADGVHSKTDSLDVKNAQGPTISTSTDLFKNYVCAFPDKDPNTFYTINSGADPYDLNREIDLIPDGASIYMVAPVRVMVSQGMLLFKNFVYTSLENWEIADAIDNLQLQYTTDGSSWSDTVTNPNLITGVKIFLLARSLEPEPGFVSNATFTLAGQTVGPFTDQYHRQVHEQIVWIRNTQ